MNLKKMLLGNLEEKQVKAFESRKTRGSRIADRRYVQLIRTAPKMSVVRRSQITTDIIMFY